MILDPVTIKSAVTLTAVVVEGGLTDDPSSVAGDAAGAGSADGSVALDQAAAGAATGTGAASGTADLDQAISGGADGSGSASGDVFESSNIPVSGSADGTGAADGSVTLDQALSGAASGAADAAGDVTADQALSGSAAGAGDASGAMALDQGIAGAAAGSADATGDVSPPAATAIYVYPNSLWNNGITEHVAYWLGLIEEEDATDIFYDGASHGFFSTASFTADDPLALIQGATSIRGQGGSGYTDVVFVANNFVQGAGTSGTQYENHRDQMDTLIGHFLVTLGETPVFWIHSGIPEGTMLTAPIGSATRDELDDMFDTVRSGSYPDWYDTLRTDILVLQPSADLRIAQIGQIFANAVQGTALIDLGPDDFFIDTDPHGTDLHYAMKAMIFFAYTEGYVPTSSSWATGLDATFIANYTAIAARIEDLVLGNPVTPAAPLHSDFSVGTGSGANEIDVTISVVDEASPTDISVTLDGGAPISLGAVVPGTYAVAAPSPSTAYDVRVIVSNAQGAGQPSRVQSATSASSGATAISGSATGSADAAGSVDLDQSIGGGAAGSGDASGDVSAADTISGSATASGSATGDVSLDQGISGGAAGAGSAAGDVSRQPDALTSGQWTVTTGTGDAELDFSIVTAPDSDEPITSYLYSTDGGATTATLPGGTATGATRTVSTLSAGGAISSGQVFTSQLAVYAVSDAGTSLISDLKTATAGSPAGVNSTNWAAGARLDFAGPASETQAVAALQFTPTANWASGHSVAEEMGALVYAFNATDMATYDDATGFNSGAMPGTIGTTEYAVLINVDRAGGLAGGNSVSVQVNGSTLLSTSGTGAASSMAAFSLFNGLETELAFAWVAFGANNEDFADYFASNEALSGFATDSVVDGVTPDVFIYDATAATLNGGSDSDGNTITVVGGPVTDA